MGAGALFVAYLGDDFASHPVRVVSNASAGSAVREVAVTLVPGARGVWVTDYTQLTMAAQFEDEGPVHDSSGELLVSTQDRVAVTLRDLGDQLELVVAPAGHEDLLAAPTTVSWFDS